jgi:hypothetical protein
LGDIASIATTGGALVVIYAAYVAVGQLREMTKARHLEAMLRVYEIIGSENARPSRKFIHSELASQPESMTPEERDHIERTAVALDQVGALTEAGLVPIGPLFSSHGEMIFRTWEKVVPYVQYRRQNIDSTFATHFEKLASSAQHYLTTNTTGPQSAGTETIPGRKIFTLAHDKPISRANGSLRKYMRPDNLEPAARNMNSQPGISNSGQEDEPHEV